MAMVFETMPQPSVMVIEEPPPTIIQPMFQPMVQPMVQPVTMVQAAPPPPTVIQTQPTVMVQQVPGPVVIQPNLKETPGRMKCNYCQQEIVTIAKPINGALTWTVFGVLLVFFIWPCCLIPFCVSSCKDIEHSCPYCHNVIQIYRRM